MNIPWVRPKTTALLTVSAVLLIIPAAAQADLILALTPAAITTGPGETITFTGTVTNTTGVTLNATDMFLNFSGFDPTALTNINQLLGNPDFTLPDHHISSVVDLFSLTVAPGTPNGSYTLDVSLEDVNNNTSPIVTATVRLGNSAVPEPASAVLSLIGVVTFAFILVRARGNKQRAAIGHSRC